MENALIEETFKRNDNLALTLISKEKKKRRVLEVGKWADFVLYDKTL
jgi:hypothetical protein